jgi:hypothetical protein
LNCGSALTGPFCSACGQRNVPPYPTVRDLAVDAFWELSGWDGRFAGTVRALVRRPGMLTREFLEGRRVRYISPLRLYLMASLVYFLVAAAVPNEKPGTAVDAGGIRIGVFTPAPKGTKVDSIAAAAERADDLKSIEEAPAWIRPVLKRAVEDPSGLRRALLESMPKMLFALLPVFALILALFYRGKNYPEHLYFAVHLHAFIFLALTLSGLAKLTGSNPVGLVVGLAIALWIPVYLHVALRQVYGGSHARTLAKASGIGAIYALISIPAWFGLVMWAARSG